MRAALRAFSRQSPSLLIRCMATGAKRKMAPQIGTHSGSFHCDEALATFMLKQTSKFGGADVVRTRDPEVLKGMDVVVDVGGVYDPGK